MGNKGKRGTRLLREPRTTDAAPVITIAPTEGHRVTIMSPNWCDRTTWYYESKRVADEVLTNSGDNTSYTPSVKRAWIDITHGKITDELLMEDAYQPVIMVDSTVKTENEPDAYDGDYSIDYRDGAVIFNSALTGSEVVTATYSYEDGSSWVIKPDVGTKMRITEVEVQFGSDTEMSDTLIFQPYGYVEDFAPQYTPVPYPAGTLIPLGSPSSYKTIYDFINDACRSYPVIPKMGGTGWRGMKYDVHIFRWDYKATTDLHADSGMEIRISLVNDKEFVGTFASATFYGLSVVTGEE